MQRKTLGSTAFLLAALVIFEFESFAQTTVEASQQANHWMVLRGRRVTVGVDRNLRLNVYQGQPAELVWQSMASSLPVATVGVAGRKEPLSVPFADAIKTEVEAFDDGTHRGRRIRLAGFANADIEIGLVLGLDANGELLVEVEQAGGQDAVRRIEGLYDWQLKPAPDAYMIVPRGSGYIIRADSPHTVDISGFIGAAHTLPVFGIVRANNTFYQIVETWWDAQVSVKHAPNEQTVLSFDWEASLGKLNYKRRALLRFTKGLDHVGVAKAYRRYLMDRGDFKTLAERAESLPVLKKYLHGVEYRWVHWEEGQTEQILANIRNFQKAGLPITFFYPKGPSQGLGRSDKFDGGWQSFVHPNPVPGGWPAAKELLDKVHEQDCLVKRMLTPHYMYEDAPQYDPVKRSGVDFPRISDRYAEWSINLVFDFLKKQDFAIDALYFDGHSAYRGHEEHQGDGEPVSRRETYEAQLAQFRETRRRGVIPGAELARFWSIAECDFFFFTDWSRDRLRHGEPIPWVPLVYHDCYGAHFSGGGYYDEGRYDWYADRHPRLYELMYAAIPSHNWLPGGSKPIEPDDWSSDKMNRRLSWLNRWHTYYQAVCYAEMTNHQFLNPQRTVQRVEFAGGIVADFDLEKGFFRVQGVDGFSGDWETPETIER